MATFSEIIDELNSLPLGNVYEKQINGKTYFYHQYFKNGKRYTKIISYDDVAELITKIEHRKKLEKILKELKNKDRDVTLSESARNLTGDVMSGNRSVATFKSGKLIEIDEQRAPLVIEKTKSLEAFLKLRMIDLSRTNARILKKIMHICEDEDYKIPLYAYALSISDDYWFKPNHSKVTYQSIRFNNDYYSDLSLKGKVSSFVKKTKLTPEITTTGSFEKGWKLINGHWWLYKNGTKEQIFSELFCYHFAKLMGLDTAVYEYDDGYIRSLNFAEKYNFEPLASILGNKDDYDRTFNVVLNFGEDIAKQYLKLIFYDSVINNVDRHNENAGFMRKRGSGRIISLAPNFDNNLALISNGNINKNASKDGLIKEFISFIKKNTKAQSLLKQISFKNISQKEIEEIIKEIPIKIENTSDIVEAVFDRYNYLKTAF